MIFGIFVTSSQGWPPLPCLLAFFVIFANFCDFFAFSMILGIFHDFGHFP